VSKGTINVRFDWFYRLHSGG